LKEKLAKLRCLSCGYHWEDHPGPHSSFWTKPEDQNKFCPKCGHLYAVWENYSEFSTAWEEYNATRHRNS